MIEISKLNKTLGNRKIINDLSFSSIQKECLGLFGDDDSAKTMLLKLIAGAIPPCSGHIKIDTLDTRTHSIKARKLIGYQVEQGLSHPTITVNKVLHYMAAIRGFSGNEKRWRVAEAVARLELLAVLNTPLDALPIDLKRKVAIAQAILHTPTLLLLDQPTQGLAPDQIYAFKETVQALTQEMTVIIASRNADHLSELCTRALIITDGQLVADAPLLDLQRNSRHCQAVTLSADTPLDLLSLAVLPGVAGIEEHRHAPGTVTVLAMPGHAIYPHINTLIANRRWKINTWRLEPGRLSDPRQNPSQLGSL